MKPKIHTVLVRTSSTETGPHFWLSQLGCSRKAWLDGLAKQERDPSRLSGIIYFDIGSIFHGLKALHYSLPAEKAMAIDTNYLQYKTPGGPLDVEAYEEAIREGERLYRSYRAYWGPNDLGKIVAVERDLASKSLVEGIEITGGVDLICRLGKRALKRLNLDGEPGLYAVDTKTRGGKDAMEYELALHDTQFSTYTQLVEQAYKEEVKGFIVDLAYKGSTATFERILVPRMALKAEWEVTKRAFKLARDRRQAALNAIQEGGLPAANIKECFKRSRAGWDVCNYYKNGSCGRK